MLKNAGPASFAARWRSNSYGFWRRAYRFSRGQIATVLEELVSTEGLVVEAADDVVRASSSYRRGGVCFSDLMILAAAERAGARPVCTFDRAFARLEGAALVEDATVGELP